ncbi:MAG: hypothetical protein LBV80_06220 [Deltaproteobacteria bacterium]|jgi:hypothetical protein|nr:hypothetical protein [Deltaproteobacteria bacterium]
MPKQMDGSYRYADADWPNVTCTLHTSHEELFKGLEVMLYGDRENNIDPHDRSIKPMIPHCNVCNEDKERYDTLSVLGNIGAAEIKEYHERIVPLYNNVVIYNKNNQRNIDMLYDVIRSIWHNVLTLRLISDAALSMFVNSPTAQAKGYIRTEPNRPDCIGFMKSNGPEYVALNLNEESFHCLSVLNEASNCIKHIRKNKIDQWVSSADPRLVVFPKEDKKTGVIPVEFQQRVYDLIAGTNRFVASIFNKIEV